MIIVLKPSATEKDVITVSNRIEKMGLKVHVSKGAERVLVGAIGDESLLKPDQLRAFRFVEKVMPILKPYKLVSREFQEKDSVIKVDGIPVGGKHLAVIAGPCSVESKEQLMATANAVKKSGAHFLRGGAFKPRTSAYDFQGLGEEGLKLLQQAKKATGMPIVTEVMDTRDVELVAKYADIIQIGARNMQNFPLLKAVGKLKTPILLKRGLTAQLKEFLMCAEYIMAEGNHNVILCERGIRTFVTYTRNTLDLNIVPELKKLTHLPVIVDPSHGTGKYDLVEPMAKASIAAGADGLSIEVHTNPEEALSDGDQSLTPKKFQRLMESAKPIAKAVGRLL